MVASWARMWDEFVPFLAFPVELRKIVYTTNAFELIRPNSVARLGGAPAGRVSMPITYACAVLVGCG